MEQKHSNIAVSVIIPTYGTPCFLDKSIDSVKAQTMQAWELIVVDDNNPDTAARAETEKLIQRYADDARIRYVKHDKNRNGSAARNTGLRYAKGKYIAFLDSDDEYLPARLEICCNAMEQNEDPQIAGVYSGCEFRRGGKTYHTVQRVQTGNFLFETLACTFNFCSGSNIFMLADAIRQIDGFDERFLRHQDYEFLVRYFCKYKLQAIDGVLLIKNNENFNVPKTEKMIAIKEQYLQTFDHLIQAQPEEKQKKIFWSQYIAIAEYAAREKKCRLALQYCNKAKAYGKIPLKRWVRLGLLLCKAIVAQG